MGKNKNKNKNKSSAGSGSGSGSGSGASFREASGMDSASASGANVGGGAGDDGDDDSPSLTPLDEPLAASQQEEEEEEKEEEEEEEDPVEDPTGPVQEPPHQSSEEDEEPEPEPEPAPDSDPFPPPPPPTSADETDTDKTTPVTGEEKDADDGDILARLQQADLTKDDEEEEDDIQAAPEATTRTNNNVDDDMTMNDLFGGFFAKASAAASRVGEAVVRDLANFTDTVTDVIERSADASTAAADSSPTPTPPPPPPPSSSSSAEDASAETRARGDSGGGFGGGWFLNAIRSGTQEMISTVRDGARDLKELQQRSAVAGAISSLAESTTSLINSAIPRGGGGTDGASTAADRRRVTFQTVFDERVGTSSEEALEALAEDEGLRISATRASGTPSQKHHVEEELLASLSTLDPSLPQMGDSVSPRAADIPVASEAPPGYARRASTAEKCIERAGAVAALPDGGDEESEDSPPTDAWPTAAADLCASAIAEVLAGAAQHIASLASAAHANESAPAALGGGAWPDDSHGRAKTARPHCLLLQRDVRAVSAAFTSAVHKRLETMRKAWEEECYDPTPDEAAARGGQLQLVHAALDAISEDEANAVARIKGYSAMLAKVCVGTALQHWLHDEQLRHETKHSA